VRRSSAVMPCHSSASPASSSSKANAHSPLRLIQPDRRNWGRGYSGRGMPPCPPLLAMVDLLCRAPMLQGPFIPRASGNPLRSMTSLYQRALVFGMRRWVP